MNTIKLEEPDKGRAWGIAFAACIINMILSGLSRMIGLLYVAVIDDYGTTREEATLPFTVRNGIRCLSGPLVGIVGQRFGIRTVTFWGGLVAATGAGLCAIAPDVTWLAVFWGGIHGCGFAFANTLFQVVVNQYFNKYRATASGIALSGACFGSLVFPFMLEEALYKYGLHGSFLILAGVVMHVLPPSILLTSPQWILYPEAYARLWDLQHGGKSVDSEKTAPVEVMIPSQQQLASDIRLERTTSMSNNPVECMQLMKTTTRQLSYEKEKVFISASEELSSDHRRDSEPYVVCTLYRTKGTPRMIRSANENGYHVPKDASTVYSVSEQVSEQKSSEVESDENGPKNEEQEAANPKSISESLKLIGRLYTNPVYILISICMATYVIIFIPILTVIVDYSVDKGIPESNGKYLINAMALGDLAGRLCFGWVTDRKYMTIPSFMALVLCMQGLFIVLFPFGMSLYSFMILLVLYGMAAGSILVLFPVLVLQYMSVNEQSVGIACVGFLSGIVSFALPPMIGHFRDTIGSYDGMFYLTGVISVLSGGMWLLEPVVLKWYSKTSGFKANQRELFADATVGNSQKELFNGGQHKRS